MSDTDRQLLGAGEDKRHIHCARYSRRRNVVNGIHLIALHSLAKRASGGPDSSTNISAIKFEVELGEISLRGGSLGARLFAHSHFVLLCFKIHNYEQP